MFQLPIDKQVRCDLRITDSAGNPASIDGKPTWFADNESVFLDVADDGMSALIVPADVLPEDPSLQVSKVTVTADADLGEGVEPIVGVLTIAVTGGRARFVELVPGALEDKTPA